jgi:hypothetical protein
MVVAFRLGSSSCLVRFLLSNLFISGIYYYTCCEVFGSLKVYFISGFSTGFICNGFSLFIVLWDIAHAAFGNSWGVRNLHVIVLRLNELAKSIMSLHTRLLRPSTNICTILQCILHSLRVIDNAREDPSPGHRIFMPKEVHLRQLATLTYQITPS